MSDKPTVSKSSTMLTMLSSRRSVVPRSLISRMTSATTLHTVIMALAGNMTILNPSFSSSATGIRGDLPFSAKLYSRGTSKALVTRSASSGVRNASTNRRMSACRDVCLAPP